MKNNNSDFTMLEHLIILGVFLLVVYTVFNLSSVDR